MLLTRKMLNSLSAKAIASPRLRINFNLHEDVNEPVQRLFNALEPNTDVPIHRHRNASETIIILKGKMLVVFYDNEKNEMESFLLDSESENFGLHISKGVWHRVKVIESHTVIFEVKEGPYIPLTEMDVLS